MYTRLLILLAATTFGILVACGPSPKKNGTTETADEVTLPDGKATYKEVCPDPVSLDLRDGETDTSGLNAIVDGQNHNVELMSLTFFRTFIGTDNKADSISGELSGPIQVTLNAQTVKLLETLMSVTCHTTKPDAGSEKGTTLKMPLQVLPQEISAKDGKIIGMINFAFQADKGNAGGEIAMVHPPADATALTFIGSTGSTPDLPVGAGKNVQPIYKYSIDADKNLHMRAQITTTLDGGGRDVIEFEAIYGKKSVPTK